MTTVTLSPYQVAIARVLFRQYRDGIDEKRVAALTKFEGLIDSDELDYMISECDDFLAQLPKSEDKEDSQPIYS